MATTTRRTRTQIRGPRTLPTDRARSAEPLDRLLLDGRRLDMQVGDRLTDAKLTRSTDGSPTVSLTLWDEDRRILSFGALGVRIMSRVATVSFDGLRYSVAGVSRGADELLVVTCESANFLKLKRSGKTKPLRATRDETTRAEFCARQIRAAGVPCIVLDEHVGQRIAGTHTLSGTVARARRTETAPPRSRTTSKGVTTRGLTIKRDRPDAEQRRVMATMRDAINEADAPPRAAETLLCATIQENVARGPNVLQVTDRTARSLGLNPRDTKACALVFLRKGFTGTGKGAIAYAREHPSWTPGQIIQAMQNPGTPAGDYDQWRSEAAAWRDAGGTTTASSSGPDGAYVYERKRGESVFASVKRLLDEVGWRLFEREGVIVIASDPALARSKPSFTITDDTDFWVPEFEWHRALRVSELSGRIAAGRYQADPGEVVRVEGLSQTQRDWLIASTTVDLLDPSTPVELALMQPQDPALEPAAEQASASSSASGTTAGSLRERIVAQAEASLTSKTGFRRYDQNGALTADPTPRTGRTDCSQWVRAVYLKAGAPDPGTSTYFQNQRGRRTSRPKPGDLLMLPGHVELYVGGGRTIGHGTAPIDYATVGAFPGHWFVTFDGLDD